MRKRGRVATERGVLFRENALWNAGYAYNLWQTHLAAGHTQ